MEENFTAQIPIFKMLTEPSMFIVLNCLFFYLKHRDVYIVSQWNLKFGFFFPFKAARSRFPFGRCQIGIRFKSKGNLFYYWSKIVLCNYDIKRAHQPLVLHLCDICAWRRFADHVSSFSASIKVGEMKLEEVQNNY